MKRYEIGILNSKRDTLTSKLALESLKALIQESGPYQLRLLQTLSLLDERITSLESEIAHLQKKVGIIQ